MRKEDDAMTPASQVPEELLEKCKDAFQKAYDFRLDNPLGIEVDDHEEQCENDALRAVISLVQAEQVKKDAEIARAEGVLDEHSCCREVCSVIASAIERQAQEGRS